MSKATRGSVGAERARVSGGPADPSATSRGRFSVKKKAEAVLRVMRGESLDSVSRDLGVTAAKLSEWRDQFHSGAQAALRSRPSDERDERVKDLQAKIGELTMDNELLQQRIDRLEARRPLAHGSRRCGLGPHRAPPHLADASRHPSRVRQQRARPRVSRR